MSLLLNLAPPWFFRYDVALELLFAVIALMVSIFAFKIYKVTNQNQIKLFGISFSLISISYFIQSIFNYLIISKAKENIYMIFKIQSIAWFDSMGLYAHIIFMTIGLAVLAYMTFRTKKIRILWLIITMSLLGIFLSVNPFYTFFLFSTIYLVFLSWHFITNYLQNKQWKTLLIVVAFLFMLFGSVHFLVSVNHQLFYVIGQILELFAYSLIFINFYLVRKK
jgi:hypothetical protein